MTVDDIDVQATVKKLQKLLAKEQNISPALSTTLETLLLVVQLLINRLNLYSRNSSKPPSSDENCSRKKSSGANKRKAGGQPGSVGVTLRQVDDPDKIEILAIDRSTLPPGEYREAGFDRRQVFDIDINRIVTEYRAKILVNANGERFVAPFPGHVGKAVQYGAGVKAHAVYLTQHQLIPYQRVQEYFQDQLNLPVSVGSIYNFHQQAFALLEPFEQGLIGHLVASPLLHTDETSINIDGKLHWLYCHSNARWTLFYAHTRRGADAMNTTI